MFSTFKFLLPHFDKIVQSSLLWDVSKIIYKDTVKELVVEESHLNLRELDKESIEIQSTRLKEKFTRVICNRCKRTDYHQNRCPIKIINLRN